MIKQAKWIKDFCKKEGFNFVDCNEDNRKVPCSLDKNYVEDNQTIFIKGFLVGSRNIQISRGGLRIDNSLRVTIDSINDKKWVRENCLPSEFICNKCKKKNLNLRTQDDHKTYDCPDCQDGAEKERKTK